MNLRALTLVFAMLTALGAAVLPAADANSATRAWSWQNPLPQGNALNGVWGSGSSVFAVGNAGAIVRFNGADWINMDSGVTAALYGVWGTSPTDVFAVGTSGTILHYNGTRWRPMTSGTPLRLRAVWGTASNNVFAVGAAGVILRYNGTAWQSMPSGTVSTLYGIWGASANDIYAVGGSGVALHFDGTAWSTLNSGIDTTLYALWGADSNNLFAAGNGGVIYHFDGTNWTQMESPASVALYTVWGSAADDVYAAGLGGWVLHFDGSNWSAMASDSNEALYGLWGDSATNLYGVGNAGTIMRYDGTAWHMMSSGEPVTMYDVWGSSPLDFYAVGNYGTVLHHDGLRWTRMTTNSGARLRGVWGNNSNDVFAVGLSGTILHYDGSTWSPMSSGRTETLNAVWGSSPNNVFAVGTNGVILRYNGLTWTQMTSGTTETLNGVWGSSGNSVFAVGSDGVILRYNGSAWTPMNSGVALNLYGVWGTSAINLYAVGLSGIILRYNGSTWTKMESGTYNIIYDVWGSSANNLYAVTATGAILVGDGTTWSSMISGTASALYGVWGSSGGDVFTVGLGGTILHYGATLDLQKRATPVIAAPGQPVTFTLSYSNTSATKASQVYITDTIPVSFTVTGVQHSGAAITDTLHTPAYAWRIADLAPNAGGVITISTILSATLPAGAIVENGAIMVASGDLWSASTADVAVDKASSTTTLATPPAATVFGESVPLTATVSVNLPSLGRATGTVRFMRNGTTLGTAALNENGVATITVNGLATGNNQLTAVYAGDANVAGSSSPSAAHTVNKAQTDITIVSSPSPSVLNENVTFTLRVTARLPGAGTPTGTVTMTVAGATLATTLVGGQATFSKSDLALATHVVTGTYGGDTNFLASTPANYAHSVKCLGTVLSVNEGEGSLRKTIEAVCPDAVIDFHPSLSGQTIVLTGTIESAKDITIRDTNPNKITVSAAGNGPIFRVPVGGALTLQQLNLANTIGGALFNRGTLNVYDVTFRENSSPLGGAIFSTGTLTVSSSVFLTNTTQGDGGAIAVTGSGARTWVRNSTFLANAAQGDGGAIASEGVLVLANSTFAGNQATAGGALRTEAGSSTIYNTSFAANGISNNTGATTTLYNTAVAGTPGCAGVVVDGGHNLDSGSSCGFATGNGSISNADPLWSGPGDFGGLNRTLALLPGSPAINAGDNMICLNATVDGADQRGVSRTQHGLCDVGAFESQGFTMTVTGGGQEATVHNPFAQALVATVTGAQWQSKSEPVNGGKVGFVVPSTGASATLAPSATVTLANGQAAVSATANGMVGAYQVEISARGAGNAALSLENVLWPTTTALQIVPGSGKVGDTITFTAVVASASPGHLGTPSGEVAFADELGIFETKVTLENGMAVFTLEDLGPDTYKVIATYLGSTIHASSASAPFDLVVDKIATTTKVEATTTTPTPGQLVVITATVKQEGDVPPSGLPSGFVDLRLNGVLHASKFLNNGVVTTTFQTTTQDTWVVHASYPGDGANKASSHYIYLTVGKRQTNTTLQVSLNPSRQGENVTFTVSINAAGASLTGLPRGAGNYPTGYIIFKSDGTEFGRALPAQGVGTLSTTRLPVGTHSIVAHYVGDDRFAASDSAPLIHTVRPLPMAVNDAGGVLQDNSVAVPVTANDLDPVGGGLTIVNISARGFGSAVVGNDGQSIVYTPQEGFSGVDFVEYTIRDASGSEDSATMTVVVADSTKAAAAPRIIPVDPRVATQFELTSAHTTMQVQLPAGFYTGTLDLDDIFFLSYTPIVTATQNTGMPPGTLVFGNIEFELDAFHNETIQMGLTFGAPVTLTITYDPAILGELDEGTVSLYYWNGTRWSDSGIYILDRSLARHRIIVTIAHLSHFAFFLSAPTALDLAPEPDFVAHLYLPVLQQRAAPPVSLLDARPESAPSATEVTAPLPEMAPADEEVPPGEGPAAAPSPATPGEETPRAEEIGLPDEQNAPADTLAGEEAKTPGAHAAQLYLPAIAIDGSLASLPAPEPEAGAMTPLPAAEAAFQIYLVIVQP